MRVLVVGYAGSTHVQEWCRQLRAAGLDVVHFSPFERAYASGPKHQSLRQLRDFSHELRRLRETVEQTQPDVVNAHIASSAGILAQWVNLPLVITAYGSDITEFPRRSQMHSSALRRALTKADALTVSSRYLKNALMDLGYQVKTPHVVPFGVDLDAFGHGVAPKASNTFTLGTVKSHEYVYGVDLLIRAFATARENSSAEVHWKLVVVGGGSRLREHEQLAARLGIADVVEFRGFVPHQDVPRILAEFDVFAALSREESFGVAAVEAMAAGIPCIVTNVGGLPEVVGRTGVIVPSDDVSAAAAAISRLHSDATLRARLAADGRSRAAALFGESTCRARLVAVLREASKCS